MSTGFNSVIFSSGFIGFQRTASQISMDEPSSRQLRTGPGWRVGWGERRSPYCALLGTDDWAVELTAEEFQEFCRLVGQLAETMQHMQTELMDEERISCEAEGDRLWVEVEGYPQTYQLRFILLSDRGVEGAWAPEAVPQVLKAIQMLEVF
jgi:hypothetical protein